MYMYCYSIATRVQLLGVNQSEGMATKLPKLEGTAKINIRGEWFTDNNPVTMVDVYCNLQDVNSVTSIN